MQVQQEQEEKNGVILGSLTSEQRSVKRRDKVQIPRYLDISCLRDDYQRRFIINSSSTSIRLPEKLSLAIDQSS